MEQINQIREYVNNRFATYLMGRRLKDHLNDSLDLMEKHINILDNDEKIEKFDDAPIKDAIGFLSQIVLEKYLDEKAKEFLHNYSYLVYNWNDNVLNEDVLRKRCRYLNRVANDELCLDELHQTLNEVTNRLRRNAEYMPRSFELSRHYFEILNED
jgi:hypothetical protein